MRLSTALPDNRIYKVHQPAAKQDVTIRVKYEGAVYPITTPGQRAAQGVSQRPESVEA
jgi:hypothetical protein